MKKLTPYLGIFLIIIGALVLWVTRFHLLTNHNSMLITGLLLIVAGIIAHIINIKHESKY